MGMDLIEIALDRMSDFGEFERLASEVMYLEGWVDLRPLGGVSDDGQDAVSERLYRQGGDITRTVFQYTLQAYLPGKVNDTIETLRTNGVAFDELVAVTPHAISSEAQIKMKRDARVTHGVTLNIYERKTLTNRLADYDNGVFNRYFPNIAAQVADLKRPASDASIPEPKLEGALLQASLALTFVPGASRARKTVFDYFVLALLMSEPEQSVTSTALAARAAAGLKNKKDIPEEQIDAALKRLEKLQLVQYSAGKAIATSNAVAHLAAGAVRLNEATSSFAVDVVSEIRSALGSRLSNETERRIARNTREVLLEIARSRAPAVLDEAFVEIDERLATLARKQLTQEVGDALVAAIADTLRSPTKDQATTMALWTQAYIAFAIMGLDPALNAFQTSRFRGKMFILDTDVVLEAIVAGVPRSSGLRGIIASLLQMGARVLIPETVLAECVEHAQRSHKTYTYFGDVLLQMTAALVEEQVWNVFVKGYYHAVISHRVPPSWAYSNYLSNFYEPQQAHQFMRDTVLQELPEGVEIVSLTNIRPESLTDDEIEKFTVGLKADLGGSKKSSYRKDEDEEKLAQTDAMLFLTALRSNLPDESESASVLGGTCYLVTETHRYTRVAGLLGVHTKVTAKPSALASIQELIGTFDVPPSEFVQLFENPLLGSVVGRVWPDLEKLVRSGISLRGKSLPRLRFDLDSAFHAQIASLSEAEHEEESSSHSTNVADEEFMKLLETAKGRGYSLVPEVGVLRERVMSGERRAQDLQAALDEIGSKSKALEDKIAFFGKRKQRYLRRVLQGEREPKR